MNLSAQRDAIIRERLKLWSWRDRIACVYAGLIPGVISSLFALSKGISPVIAWTTGIGSGIALGLYCGNWWSKRSTRVFAKYFIAIEAESFRIKGLANGALQEVRFSTADVRCVLPGIAKRPALVSGHPLVRDLDSHALTIIEKSGASITFEWALSVFSPSDLNLLFDHLRSQGIDSPTMRLSETGPCVQIASNPEPPLLP